MPPNLPVPIYKNLPSKVASFISLLRWQQQEVPKPRQKTMGFCYEFYIPSPFFQGATRLCVCIENNRWSFLLSQVPELGRGRTEETWTRIHWTRWYRMEPIRFHRVPRALHPMSFLTNEENVGSVGEDVFFKAGWANMFKIRELVGNSLWIDSIYTLETVAFSAGEE